jgi:hypothetical protein
MGGAERERIVSGAAALGEEPMRALFDRVAQPILQPGTGQGWFGPWRVMALDGVMLDVPDTADNVERFGRSDNAAADSPSRKHG